MSIGYVYILTNEAMPGLVKVGKTTRTPEERAVQLFVTGVPQPFEVHTSFHSPNCDRLEQVAHEALAEFRVSDCREFFQCDPEEAFNAVSGAHINQVATWVGHFTPGWEISHPDFCVNASTIHPAALEADLDVADAIRALAGVSSDELSTLVERWRGTRERKGLSVVEGGAA